MDQNQTPDAMPSDDEIGRVIKTVGEELVRSLGHLNPALAVGGLLHALEMIACMSNNPGFVTGVAQSLDESASILRRAALTAPVASRVPT